MAALLLLGMALLFALGGCSRDYYSSEAIEARVVDADSGTPVEGVNVIAAWQLKGGLEGGNIAGYLEVLEAVTDHDGVFRIPAWGPKAKTQHGGFERTAPRIMLFKSGYQYRQVENKSPPQRRGFLQSDWNGKTITLPRFVGSPAEYKEKLRLLSGDLHNLRGDAENHWPQIPRFLCAGARFEQELSVQGAPAALPSYEYLKGENGPRCKSPEGNEKGQRQ
jgi:hypothetical protein